MMLAVKLWIVSTMSLVSALIVNWVDPCGVSICTDLGEATVSWQTEQELVTLFQASIAMFVITLLGGIMALTYSLAFRKRVSP